MKRNMKKVQIAALFLALFLLLPLISACGNGAGTPAQTTGDGGQKATTEDTQPESNSDTSEQQYSFKSANYKERDFGILNMTQLNDFYLTPEDTGSLVDQAVAARNQLVEDKYHVLLQYHPMSGVNANKANFLAEIRANENSGIGYYSLYMGATFYTMSLITEGAYFDILKKDDVMNLNAPWWDSDVNEILTISGKLYASIGSFNAGQLSSSMGVYFNKKLYQEYQLQNVIGGKDIYDLVREKEWTFEKLRNMAKVVESNEEILGLAYDLHGIYCSIAGSDITLVEETNEGKYSILGLHNDHFISVFEDYYGLFNDSSSVAKFFSGGDLTPRFAAGTALMMIQSINDMGSGTLLESGVKYGIVPFPMYTEEQGRYYTNSQNTEITQVSATCNHEMACVLLEYLNYQSRRLLFPAYFETKLQYRLADEPDDAEMLQLIRDSLHYDFGVLFTTEIGTVWEAIRALIQNKDSNHTSWWASLGNGATPQALLDELITNYSKLP